MVQSINTLLPADDQIVLEGGLDSSSILNALVSQLKYLLDGDNQSDDGNYYTDDDWQASSFDANNIFGDDDWLLTGGNSDSQITDSDDSATDVVMSDETYDNQSETSYEENHIGNTEVQDTCAILSGTFSAGFQGEYVMSFDIFDDFYIWDRYDNNMFIAHCGGRWRIQQSSYRADYNIDVCDSLITSNNDAKEWFNADWPQDALIESCTSPTITCVQDISYGNFTISEEVYDGYPVWKSVRYVVVHYDERWQIMDSFNYYIISSTLSIATTISDSNEWYRVDWQDSPNWKFTLC